MVALPVGGGWNCMTFKVSSNPNLYASMSVFQNSANYIGSDVAHGKRPPYGCQAGL